MKPRTFTILAVVLAVIGISGFGAGWKVRNRVNDELRRIQVESDARGPVSDLDESVRIQLDAELVGIKASIDRASLLNTIGWVAWMLSMISFSARRYLAHKETERAMDQRGGPAAEDAPPATTNP